MKCVCVSALLIYTVDLLMATPENCDKARSQLYNPNGSVSRSAKQGWCVPRLVCVYGQKLFERTRHFHGLTANETVVEKNNKLHTCTVETCTQSLKATR